MKNIIAELKLGNSDIRINGDKDTVLSLLKSITNTETIQDTRLETDYKTHYVDSTDVVIPVRREKATIKNKVSKYSTEDNVAIYEWLSKTGNYSIKQFEITRGSKGDRKQYLVCLVFDNDKQRYINYNPRSEDNFKASYTPVQAIDKIKNNENGFHLIHIVAQNLKGKMEYQNGALNLNTTKVDPFDTTPLFSDYDLVSPKKSINNTVCDVLIEKNKPMHYKEIAQYVFSHKLYSGTVKSLEALILMNIGQENSFFGEQSRFVRFGKGVYGLNNKVYPGFGVSVKLSKNSA